MHFFKKQHSDNSKNSQASKAAAGGAQPAPIPALESPVPKFVGGNGNSYDMEEPDAEDEEGSYLDEDDDFLAAHESAIPPQQPHGAHPQEPPGYPSMDPYAQHAPPGYPIPAPPAGGAYPPYGDDRSYAGEMYPPPVPPQYMAPVVPDPMYPPTMNPYSGGYGVPAPAPVPVPGGYGGGADGELAMYLAQGYSFDDAVAMVSGGAMSNPYASDMSMYGSMAPPSSSASFYGGAAYGAPGYGGGGGYGASAGYGGGYGGGGGGGGYSRSNNDANEEELQRALRMSLEEERERQTRVTESQREAMEAVERANEKAIQIALQKSFEEFEEQQRNRSATAHLDPYAVDRANEEAFEAARLASLVENSRPPPPPLPTAQYPIGGVVTKTLVRVGSDPAEFQGQVPPGAGDKRIAAHYSSSQVYNQNQMGPHGAMMEHHQQHTHMQAHMQTHMQQGQYIQQSQFPTQMSQRDRMYDGQMDQHQPHHQVHTPAHQGSGLLAMRHGAPSPMVHSTPAPMMHQNSNPGSGLLNLRARSIDNNDPSGSPVINNRAGGSGLLGLRSRSNEHAMDTHSPMPPHMQGIKPLSRNDSFDSYEGLQQQQQQHAQAQPSSGLLAFRKQMPGPAAHHKPRSSSNSVDSAEHDHHRKPYPNKGRSSNNSVASSEHDSKHHRVKSSSNSVASGVENDNSSAAMRVAQAAVRSDHKPNPLGQPRMSIHRMLHEPDHDHVEKPKAAPLEIPARIEDNASYESSDSEESSQRESQGKQGSLVANAVMQNRTNPLGNPLGNPRKSVHRMQEEPKAKPFTGPRLTPSIRTRGAGSPAIGLQPNPNNPLFAKR